MRRICLCGCGQYVTGSRCTTSRQAQRAKYHGDWPQHSQQAIATHRATHGDWCPGWQHEPHPTTDLTLDHHLGVLCRACNTRKRRIDGT